MRSENANQLIQISNDHPILIVAAIIAAYIIAAHYIFGPR